MTKAYLERYDIAPENIVFEITERTNIKDKSTFVESINHYKSQKYQIAIDDFGSGFAGVNRICVLNPQYIKLDIGMIRDVHIDAVKSSMLEGLVHFCKSVGIYLIAEGIETKDELKKLIQLGVDYGQGYFLGKPNRELKVISEELRKFIVAEHKMRLEQKYTISIFGNVGSICHRKETTTRKEKAFRVFEYMEKNPVATELCVIDEEERVCGLLTRQHILECFGGRYGYNLYGRKLVEDLLKDDYLAIDSQMSIETAAKVALMRPQQQLYDAVIITKDGKYFGIVTVKDLLEATVAIQVERATDANPLTHLPGNQLIQEQIERHLNNGLGFSIMYLDLDNFKAYNDVYGFENGDLMIKAVADSMKQACQDGEFMGHVGGDDFVVISENYNLREVYQRIIDHFHACLESLYTPEDYEKKEIVSKNRRGEVEVFPLASISGALLSNEQTEINGMDDFSKKIAKLKNKASTQRVIPCANIFHQILLNRTGIEGREDCP